MYTTDTSRRKYVVFYCKQYITLEYTDTFTQKLCMNT